jgi:hypothetical protein
VMKHIIKFLPGLTAAVGAYLVIKFLFFWNDSFSVEFTGFIVVFTVIYFIVDTALRQYGTNKS